MESDRGDLSEYAVLICLETNALLSSDRKVGAYQAGLRFERHAGGWVCVSPDRNRPRQRP